MKCMAFLFAPFLGAVGVMALVGCNTAQVSQPAPIDAGPACVDHPPRLTSCDAGPPSQAPAGSCSGDFTVSVAGLDASSTFPSGMYAQGCVAVFFTDDHAGGCLDSPSCTCSAGTIDAGADDAAGDAGDGGTGPVLPGVWSCTR